MIKLCKCCKMEKEEFRGNICVDCVKKYQKEYRKNNKNKINEGKKRYRTSHKKEILAYQTEYRKTNKSKNKVKTYNHKYRKTHKKEIQRKDREYQKEKFKNDVNFKIKCHLRSRINTIIKKGKPGSAVRDLGCSVDFLKQYFESKFYSNPKTGEAMSWENYGKYGWHIDHIIPLSKFDLTDREQFLIACNYENLKPLWAEENLSKHDNLPKNYKQLLNKIKKKIKKT